MKRLGLLICMLFLSLLSWGQDYPSLDLSMNPDTIKLNVTNTRIPIYYRTEGIINLETARVQVNAFLQENLWDWLTVEEMIAPTSSSAGVMIVKVDANTTGSERVAIFISLLTSEAHFVMQRADGTLDVYTVSGNSCIFPGKSAVVNLSGSETGVTYQLFRETTLECSLAGTGRSMSFSVETPGSYTVTAIRDAETRVMEGVAKITWFPVLEDKITLDVHPEQMLPANGGVVTIPFTIASNYRNGMSELMTILNSCREGESYLWNSDFFLDCVVQSETRGSLVIGHGPNCRDSIITSLIILDVIEPVILNVFQLESGKLRPYTLSGGGEMLSGNTATLTLSGYQDFVRYKLYCNNIPVNKLMNSGCQFTGLTEYGRYRVKALYDGFEAWMPGEPGVWPMITRYQVTGGGVSPNNNPVTIRLQGSQSILVYRLLRDNVVVASLPGTGGPLSFEVVEPGVYKIEGGMQDYFVEMCDSVSVTRVAGVYYSKNRNYMVEKVHLEATTTGDGARSVSNVTYLDGFGRKLQEIQVCGSPGGVADIIVPCTYGVQGRVEKEYLPYSKVGNYGAFDANAMNFTNWNLYGESDASSAFSLTEYDNCPLDRVSKRIGPGKVWHEKSKGVTMIYGTNRSGEVRLYRVESDGTLKFDNTYPAGSLRKETVIDEDSCRVETFSDNNGQVVLTVQIEQGNRLETYSVRDDRGLLRWVLSPEASKKLGVSVNATELARLAYRYDYDSWGRLIEKRLPGCDPVYLVYDKRDRLVMSQDGKQRVENLNKWSYSLYDKRDRVIETGEVISNGITHSALQTAASASDNYIPAGTRSPLQYTLYDNYTPTGTVPVLQFQPTPGYATGYNEQVVGLVTSVKTKVMGTNTEKWLTTTTYYDDRCREIQTTTENLQGQRSRVDFEYDFTGNVIRCRESHGITASQADVLETVNTYDDRGRLTSAVTCLNGGSPATVGYGYDAVGRQTSRTIGKVTETLTYNPRGWLTGKESESFKMKLRYESPQGGARACWNGNISEWEWQHGTDVALMYGFAYDGVNRLTGMTQKQKSGTSWGTLAGSYLEKGISYDCNGNIKTLQRTAGGTLVDNLTYVYTGNQLTGLTEGVQISPTGDIYSFGGVATGSYAYDKNGNMINDSRRALNLSYNVLNLLSEVKTASGELKARYTYLSDGTKLRVRDNGEVNGFDYLGSLTYRKSSAGLQLESASFGEGMIRVDGSISGQCEVNYFLTDHLGSVRVIVDGAGKVLERNDYYPFGARHVRGDYPQLAVNRYKYNGKEDQVTGDLKYLDYGARMYDSGLGRWFGMDLMSEKYYSWSAYNYVCCNPVNAVDPNGTFTDWIQNKNGDYLWDDNAISQATTRDGWKYVGKKLPEGYDRSNILTEIDDRLYYKNSSNIFASIGNLIFGEGTFVNHKRYDPSEKEFMQNLLAASVGTVGASTLSSVVKWGTKAIKGNHTTIYRAVSQAELEDIIQFGFRNKIGSYETGKLFTPTLKEASQFGKNNFKFDKLPNTIMKVRIPNKLLKTAYKFPADGMNAISIDVNQLHLLKWKPLKFNYNVNFK